MKKEVLIAIFLGIVIGLIVTFGIRIAQQATKQTPVTPLTESIVTPEVSISPELTNVQLVITSPESGAIVETETVNIKGNTAPGAYVSFISDNDQTAAVADSLGNFSAEVGLATGPNTIYISSHQPNGTQIEQILDIVYSTADLELVTPTPTAESEKESDS